jgi:hypothetical protein
MLSTFEGDILYLSSFTSVTKVCTHKSSYILNGNSSSKPCLLTFSFGHCVVCPSSIYGFWLPSWYLQILLITICRFAYRCGNLCRQFMKQLLPFFAWNIYLHVELHLHFKYSYQAYNKINKIASFLLFGVVLLRVSEFRVVFSIMLFMLVCAKWCPTHIVLCFCFIFLRLVNPMLPVSLCFCFVFLRLVYPMLPVSLECLFLIDPSVFSNVYLQFLWIVYFWLPLRYSLTFICPVSCVSYVASFSGLSIFDCPLRYSLTFICPVSCVPSVASFSGLSIFYCTFGIL